MPTSPHPRHASTSLPSNLQSLELKTSGPTSCILNAHAPALAVDAGKGEGDTQGFGWCVAALPSVLGKEGDRDRDEDGERSEGDDKEDEDDDEE
ncbi:hypothetical protein CVT25_001022 [Psilocybe cyanescens]|uniref:Uncharacterized protein n=1 Tax=Psilocybe cyanescens TaxID=93625 RepID=A0A409X8P0_PSICY|nr:hypothetical protein CVT25_001022 [Psilocybe cyanescens]